MTPTKQTILHNPKNGLHGNCLSAVLASLLHLPIESIPVFSDPENWLKDLNAWLRQYGLAYLSFPADGFNEVLSSFGIEGLHHEIAGMTTRFFDVCHACVAKDGYVVFDPHPSNDGLNVSVDSHGIFIALRPWEKLFKTMTLSVEITVRSMNGTYQTNTVQGVRASCTAGAMQAAQRLGEKLYGASLVRVQQLPDRGDFGSTHWQLVSIYAEISNGN